MKKIIYCTLILCFAWISNAYSTPLTAEHLYFFAKQKRLNYLVAYSKYINITNQNNDTALCIAVKSNDYDAYQMLLKYGASTRVNCLANIRKSYNNTRVNGNTSNNNATFLGMGKTGWLTTGAVVAVGAGVAATAGGGGGGGSGNNSSDNTDTPSIPSVPNCVNGNLVNNKCVCNEGWQGNTCEEAESCPYNTTSCSDGYEETGNTCKSGNITYKECKEKDCSGFNYTSCPTGYSQSDFCLSGTETKIKCDNCAEGWIKQDEICYLKLNCVNGYQSGNICICYTGYEGELCTDLIKEANIVGKAEKTNNSQINIVNDKYADVYGLYAVSSNKALVYNGYTNVGNIKIKNINNGNVYGIYADKVVYNSYAYYTSSATGTIDIDNIGNGNIYGIYSTDIIYNAYTYIAAAFGSSSQANGKIYIKNTGDGNIFGLYSLSSVHNAHIIGHKNRTTLGNIEIINEGSGYSFGIYAKNSYNQSSTGQNSSVTMISIGNGYTVGLYGSDEISNSGIITIHNLGSGIAIGIYADKANVLNSGNIQINRNSYTDTNNNIYSANTPQEGMSIGIYGTSGTVITNSGTISINGAETAYGIYAEDKTVTISNTGTISIDGNTNHANAIKLNGGKLFQNGLLTANSLNLDNMGGEIVATSTSSFVAEDEISGDLAISNNVVTDGFDTTYTVADMIKASDTSKLNLVSKSAMFDASLKNGKDAVMTMKSFNDVVENKSLANFLQKNYAMQNNEKLFSNIKSAENIKSLNNFTDQMFGKDMFSRFAFEDLMIMRELNFDINNKLFNNKEDYLSVGGNKSSFAFSGNSMYSLSTVKNGKNSIGVSVAFSDINSDDGNKDNRRYDKMYNISMPIGYQANGLKFVSTPRVGYSYGTYERNGFNNQSYEGTVEKQMFAFMNEARYPLQIGGWNIAPSAELNFINYRISGHETDKEYSLKIKSQNNYSIEAGIGLYASKETKFTKDSSLRFNGGVALYHEFADPYKMKLGMEGMSGTFTLRDENRSDNRAVVQSEIEFKHNNFSIVGNVASYIDRKYETNATLDFKFGF